MSSPFENFEPLPSASVTMGRFANQARLTPQTPPEEALLAFSAAGMVATFEIERNAADLETGGTAIDLFNGMANMYQILFDQVSGFDARGDQIEEIIDAADDVRGSLVVGMGFDQPPTALADLVDLSRVCHERNLRVFQPGVNPYDLHIGLSAYISIATDRIGAVTSGQSDHLEDISSHFTDTATRLLGIDSTSEQAAEIRQRAVTVADAFLRGNQG